MKNNDTNFGRNMEDKNILDNEPIKTLEDFIRILEREETELIK